MSDDPIVQAWRIAEALAEAGSLEVDSAYETELRERGIDPDAEAERLRGLMLAQVQLARKARLQAARASLDLASSLRSARRGMEWANPRDLLQRVLDSLSPAKRELTLQYREFGALSDADVERLLNDFAELGALDNLLSDETE